jgi:hypothetical protein
MALSSSRPPQRRTDPVVTYLGHAALSHAAGKERTLLVQQSEARAAIRKSVREALRDVLPEVLALTHREEPSILTVARLADLLGVTPRTVTERYVKDGMPCCRPGGKRQPPVFILEDVIAWLRSRSD